MHWYNDDLDLRDGEELYMDEFGERIDNDRAMEEYEEELAEEEAVAAEADEHESAFHETLDQTDQIDDEKLQAEAEQDY